MATMTIKNIPDELYKRLKKQAAANRRSINNEVITLIERAAQVAQKDTEWVAPPLWLSEFRNVLALYLRQNQLSLSEIYIIARKGEKLMRGKTFHVNSLHVINLVATSNCSAYDCEFVALAHDLNVRIRVSSEGAYALH